MVFDRIRYNAGQKQTLEEKGIAYGAAREGYNRRLWDVTGELSRYGRVKRRVFDTLEFCLELTGDGYVAKAMEHVRFQVKEGKPLERTGLTGVALREWGKRDLSYPDIEGLRPQDAFEYYDRLTAELWEASEKLEDMCRPVSRWCDSGEALLEELNRRRRDPERAKPVVKLLALFLEAELFAHVDTELVLRREPIEKVSGAVLAAAGMEEAAPAAEQEREGGPA